MLRITLQRDDDKTQTIRLEGKIVGPWVDEFRRVWQSLEGAHSMRLRLDLRNVAYIDEKGRELLREIYRKTHADLLAGSPMTQYFVDRAMQQESNTSF